MAESAHLASLRALPSRPGPSAAELLERAFQGRTAAELLRLTIGQLFPGRVALVSSFGSESAVLLHLVSTIAADTPVLFLDTGKHFAGTLDYRSRLVAHLGLTDVRTVTPDPVRLVSMDAAGTLHKRNHDLCCHIRKVEPLDRALEGYDAWITGRKHFQTAGRRSLRLFEEQDGRMKVNPLAAWTPAEIEAYIEVHDLPRHPLVEQGFLSIGCEPCTSRIDTGEAARAGRWRGSDKTECGIHGPAR